MRGELAVHRQWRIHSCIGLEPMRVDIQLPHEQLCGELMARSADFDATLDELLQQLKGQ
jgi:hypothetical protein